MSLLPTKCRLSEKGGGAPGRGLSQTATFKQKDFDFFLALRGLSSRKFHFWIFLSSQCISRTPSAWKHCCAMTLTILCRITGSNKVTTESCCGILNLVDLAGSERVKVRIVSHQSNAILICWQLSYEMLVDVPHFSGTEYSQIILSLDLLTVLFWLFNSFTNYGQNIVFDLRRFTDFSGRLSIVNVSLKKIHF